MPRNRREPTRTSANRRHRRDAAGGVYANLLSADEVRALGAASDATLRDEVALLRVLVLREMEAGATAEQIRKLVREIGQALKVERAAGSAESDTVQLALDDLLAEVDREERTSTVLSSPTQSGIPNPEL